LTLILTLTIDLTFDRLNWKLAHRLILRWETFTRCVRFFHFELWARRRQTDGRTDGRRREDP